MERGRYVRYKTSRYIYGVHAYVCMYISRVETGQGSLSVGEFSKAWHFAGNWKYAYGGLHWFFVVCGRGGACVL